MKDKLNQEITWLLNEKYNGRLTAEAKKDITRLIKREPVDYVIGYKKFLGCKIDLRYMPLIPREETEFWVEEAIGDISDKGWGNIFCEHPQAKLPGSPLAKFCRGHERGRRWGDRAYHKKHFPSPYQKILDVFAGSGCCGIAILKHISNSQCDFLDIDDNCLKQIRLNLKLNGIDKKRYHVIKSDIFSAFSSANHKLLTINYNLILVNPPYIGLSERKNIQKSVLDFEPKSALFAKENGLFFIKKFLQEVKNYLSENGVIYLEFGYNQKNDIAKLLKKFGYQNFEFHKDQFNKWRFVKILDFFRD